MDKIAETSILFDLYGVLLSKKKREVMQLYYEENLSLSEIAEEQGVSRAAVHDALRTAEKNLKDYESKLGLEADFHKRQDLVNKLRGEIAKLVSAENPKSGKHIQIIEKLLSNLEE